MATRNEIRRLAEEMAREDYAVNIEVDETTETDREVFFLTAPDLPGCMAQGETLDEALDNLSAAMADYIESLLEDGLPVPPAITTITTTTTRGDESGVDDHYAQDDYEADLLKSIQPAHRHQVARVSWVELQRAG